MGARRDNSGGLSKPPLHVHAANFKAISATNNATMIMLSTLAELRPGAQKSRLIVAFRSPPAREPQHICMTRQVRLCNYMEAAQKRPSSRCDALGANLMRSYISAYKNHQEPHTLSRPSRLRPTVRTGHVEAVQPLVGRKAGRGIHLFKMRGKRFVGEAFVGFAGSSLLR